jgi:thiamine-monophosphate kinase
MGEFELIRRFFDRSPAKRALLGIGDDCALLQPQAGSMLAISTDMLVAARHFYPDVSPRALGHKALAVNLSDLAAMGAKPLAFTLALALPQADEAWLDGFSRGLFDIADRFGCELIGGDTTRGPLAISITVLGELPAGVALRRDAAQPGDDLWVSGALGASAFAVRERDAGRRLADDHPAVARLERPEPRVALGIALRHFARAAIDLSDGLIGDLGHLAERSRVGVQVIGPQVPVDAALNGQPEALARVLALAGGDDYELAFTAPPENRSAIESIGTQLGLPLARIGGIVAGQGVTVLDERGRPIHGDVRSFDHFG